MKRVIVSLTFLFMSMISFAQDHSAKIVEVYGQQEYNQMVQSNPGVIQLMNKYVEYGFEVIDSNPKYDSYVELTEIKLRSKTGETVSVAQFMTDYNSQNFNLLEYDFFPSNDTQAYRLAGYDKVIIIYNQKNILSK